MPTESSVGCCGFFKKKTPQAGASTSSDANAAQNATGNQNKVSAPVQTPSPANVANQAKAATTPPTPVTHVPLVSEQPPFIATQINPTAPQPAFINEPLPALPATSIKQDDTDPFATGGAVNPHDLVSIRFPHFPPKPKALYNVGDKVKGQFYNGRWFPATIESVSGDSFVLNWDNGSLEDRIKTAAFIKPGELSDVRQTTPNVFPSTTSFSPPPLLKSSTSFKPIFKIGDRVKGQFRDGRWYPATISSVNPDDTYLVTWDHGELDDRLKSVHFLQILVDHSHRINDSTVENASVPDKTFTSGVNVPVPLSVSPIQVQNALYSLGDRVKAQYRNGRWYPATVTAINEDGTYVISWDDGECEDLIKTTSFLQPLNPWTFQPPAREVPITPTVVSIFTPPKPIQDFVLFRIGDRVKGQRFDGRWYPATVSSVNLDGSFTVDWDSGDMSDRVKAAPFLQPAPPLKCIASQMLIGPTDRFHQTVHGPVLVQYLDSYNQMLEGLRSGLQD